MNNSRKINIDMARILACLAVVLLHTTARTIYLYETTDIVTFSIANLLNSATRWCVPVFIMRVSVSPWLFPSAVSHKDDG